VRLGYEMWRQLNNFPPRPTSEPTTDSGASAGASTW